MIKVRNNWYNRLFRSHPRQGEKKERDASNKAETLLKFSSETVRETNHGDIHRAKEITKRFALARATKSEIPRPRAGATNHGRRDAPVYQR